MGRLMSQELDRSRPLWETWIVEGFEGNRWAIVSKVHHCMVDGVAGVDLISGVLDATPDPAPADPSDWHPEAQPSPLRLALDAVANLVTSPVTSFVRSASRRRPLGAPCTARLEKSTKTSRITDAPGRNPFG
jgi:diacylglycerol O-acyltransferase